MVVLCRIDGYLKWRRTLEAHASMQRMLALPSDIVNLRRDFGWNTSVRTVRITNAESASVMDVLPILGVCTHLITYQNLRKLSKPCPNWDRKTDEGLEPMKTASQ